MVARANGVPPVERRHLSRVVGQGAQRGKPVVPFMERSNTAARRFDGVAGRGCGKKRMPRCKGADRD
jgi:hypothetical protein